MNSPFELIKTNENSFPLFIIGKSYLGLSEYISILENKLKENNFKGNVIFDLLLSNGYKARNRFLVSHFNGMNFSELHVTSINYKNTVFIKILEKYYFNNLQILNNGILSKNDIMTIKSTHSIIYKKAERNT